MALVRGKGKSVRGKADLVFFDTLFRGVWARLVSKLGVTSVRGLLEQTLQDTTVHYPILEHVRIMESGVNLTELGSHRDDRNAEAVEHALWSYLEQLASTLERLSGSVVSREIVSYITSREKGKRFGELLYRTGLKF